MRLSVVIPTFNRADTLRECLQHLEQQSLRPSEFEVVIVNDGGTDHTAQVVEEAKARGVLVVQYLEKKNQGQGIARNRGVEMAKGDVVLFIGDDIFPDKEMLARHMAVHEKYVEQSAACLGYIAWHPRIPDTPLNRFLTNGSLILGRHGGHQFAYEKLAGKDIASYDFFYTSNISLKRSLLVAHPFDESFLAYGWEDIELGYRLTKEAGLVIYYDSGTIGHHYHVIDEESLVRRMRAIGKAAVLFDRKYPELHKVPSGMKLLFQRLIGSRFFVVLFKFLSVAIPVQVLLYWYYFAISKRAFIEGLHESEVKV